MTGERAQRRWSPWLLTGMVLALAAGLAIVWIDTRPRWDDTGITAGSLLIAAGAGALISVPPWLAAALVGGPVVAAEFVGNPGVALALAIALVGAYGGALIRRLVIAR